MEYIEEINPVKQETQEYGTQMYVLNLLEKIL